ncbi:MAG: hypothetical protein ACRED0_08045 [Gammaproteobacteria bacterium]
MGDLWGRVLQRYQERMAEFLAGIEGLIEIVIDARSSGLYRRLRHLERRGTGARRSVAAGLWVSCPEKRIRMPLDKSPRQEM